MNSPMILVHRQKKYGGDLLVTYEEYLLNWSWRIAL